MFNGVYLHETDSCELIISVCPPLCEHDFSGFAQKLGMSSEDCLFFREQEACVAIFELAQSYPDLKESPLIDWPALMTAIWKRYPAYAISFNLSEQSGHHDPIANLLKALGVECEAESKSENMIAVSEDQGTKYLFFYREEGGA